MEMGGGEGVENGYIQQVLAVWVGPGVITFIPRIDFRLVRWSERNMANARAAVIR